MVFVDMCVCVCMCVQRSNVIKANVNTVFQVKAEVCAAFGPESSVSHRTEQIVSLQNSLREM